MIESLLVANRGEIACRIFRTARRLGVRAIAVFSEADVSARHVREADEAVLIGAAAPRESYLNIERILAAAKATGAQAIHPGYGFLSENAHFAQAVVDAGLVFVGPPASAIAAMGSKIVAKARMRAVGVPVLPGYEGDTQDLTQLHAEALRVGLPLIIKPAAGGGGKGMRIVREEAQIAEALAAARRLAESNFGDGSLLLERFLPAPRHIEVQVFADRHGNAVHLGDRDCSIQRRHQKLLEEAPAPDLPAALRTRLRAAAVLVAREIGYVSAGTVEFLFDGREFYFMEMNTRLQVEHTVTEAVTKLDLVEWQLRVAAGEPLPLRQADIVLDGHAMEARVCAEDPQRDFLPSAGTLRLMQWPTGESLRVDAGFETGDAVPDSYDSLLGKVIAWAPSRSACAERLSAALYQTRCVGVYTNERWLARVLDSPPFLEVRHSIAFLEEHSAEFRDSVEIDYRAVALAVLVAHGGHVDRTCEGEHVARSPWEVSDGFTPNRPAVVSYTVSRQGRRYGVDLVFERGVASAIAVEELIEGNKLEPRRLEVRGVDLTDASIAVTLRGVRVKAQFFVDGDHAHLWLGGEHYRFLIEDLRSVEFSPSASEGGLTSPLPGVVVAVKVELGQRVSSGDVLMVIEAMKMEHSIAAPYAGTVKAIHFASGQRVPEGSKLLEVTP
jgi:3-methylcrotonyl-CoA carboxylase alpha subunit